MAKLIVQHDVDPGICIILEEVLPGTPGRARGWCGTCTECGRPRQLCRGQMRAIEAARRHEPRGAAMAKIVIQHDVDPGICVILEEVLPGTPGRAQGWCGTCTECGGGVHRWSRDHAVDSAVQHIARHESGL